MLLPLLAAALLPAQLPTIRPGQLDSKVGNVVLSPEARLTRARVLFKGEEVASLGGTRTRTWLQKSTTDLMLGGNDLSAYDGGIATFGEKGSCYLGFATVPKTRYLVTFIGEFDCTGVSTMATDSKGTTQGNAVQSLAAGETSVMVPVKAVDEKTIALLFYPKGGAARFQVQRVEVTKVK